MKKQLLALAATLVVGAQALAADIKLVVQADQPGPVIHRNIYGQFAEHLGTGIYEGMWVGPESKIPNVRGWRKDVVAALKDLKVPLVRWYKGLKFAMAQHALLGNLPLGPVRAALLHFKMFDDLPVKCESASVRREYYEEGREYRILAEAIRKAPNRSFYDPKYSVRYEGAAQLVALGLTHPFGAPIRK